MPVRVKPNKWAVEKRRGLVENVRIFYGILDPNYFGAKLLSAADS